MDCTGIHVGQRDREGELGVKEGELLSGGNTEDQLLIALRLITQSFARYRLLQLPPGHLLPLQTTVDGYRALIQGTEIPE